MSCKCKTNDTTSDFTLPKYTWTSFGTDYCYGACQILQDIIKQLLKRIEDLEKKLDQE